MTETKVVGVKCIHVNHFNEESTRTFYEAFMKMVDDKYDLIPIVIDSFGGSAASLMAMMDIINSVDIPVATIGMGKAMSCGFFLLASGTQGYRYMAPTATAMIHHVGGFTMGKEPELAANVEETKRLQEVVFNHLDKQCGQKKGYFLKQLKERGNVNWYMTAREAKAHGVVDMVKLPIITTSKNSVVTVTLK